MHLGIDTGGTFTDFVLLDGNSLRLHKVLSTPDDPSRAILQGIAELGLDAAAAAGGLQVIHGSTVATNAALEGKGARTAFVTNSGFTDLLSIGRQARRDLYSLAPTEAPDPVPADLCFGVAGRLAADGSEVVPLDAAAIAQLVAELDAAAPDSVAICLLHAWANPEHELQLEQALQHLPLVCRSSAVLPEYREYERGMATWLNAWLGPLVHRYLTRLQTALGATPLAVMQSSGGTIAAGLAAERAVNLLLSGPAGGLAAAAFAAASCSPEGRAPALLTFDMGGTSSDVALVDGSPALTSSGSIRGWPVAVPMVDMHTIGAGGGSVASLDAGGALQVGPESAGADPGPACYGRGGTRATVSDANAVLGRLLPDAFLGGRMALDLAAARSAVAAIADGLGSSLEAAADGIIQLANAHMAQALRVISVERGRDPRDFTLCCFGGAGGLHVCALADDLGMTRILVPRLGGVLSALGMLVAPARRHSSRTIRQPLANSSSADLDLAFQAMARHADDDLAREGHSPSGISHQPSLDLCYRGQSSTLNLPWSGQQPDVLAAAFHQQHEQRYGHQLRLPVDVVNLRLDASHPAPPLTLPPLPKTPVLPPAEPAQRVLLHGVGDTLVQHRDSLAPGQQFHGPALVVEDTATTYLSPGWQARVDELGHLHLTRSS